MVGLEMSGIWENGDFFFTSSLLFTFLSADRQVTFALKIMAVKQEALDEILEQLSEVQDFTYKKMFGGVGFFRDVFMWGSIMGGDDLLRLKADEHTQQKFEDFGSTPFHYEMKSKKGMMPYWVVPEHVFADKNLLAEWVEVAVEVAVRTKKTIKKRKKKAGK